MKFLELLEGYYKQIERESIIYYKEVRGYCKLKYPDHPHGCPNIEKCNRLNIPYFGKLLNDNEFDYFYLLYFIFDFEKYQKKRIEENSDFFNTKRKVRNLLYWQKSINFIIKDYLERIHSLNLQKDFYVLANGSGFNLSYQSPVGSMENSCIDVFQTLEINEISFEKNPETFITLCNLLCSKFKLKIPKLKEKKMNLSFFIEKNEKIIKEN